MIKYLRRTGIAILIILLISAVFLIIVSPGKPSPILDAAGNTLRNSISTIEKPVIGGIPQGMIIRGEDVNNPVLLFVHGGPGGPSFPGIKNDLKKLEKIFTICYWEQRGAGMSYSSKIPASTMTLQQMVEDAAEVSRYLIKKFHKEKIYILGHSWGSFLSSFTIHKYPQLYYAYLAIGQMADTYVSEQESYRFVINEAINRHDKEAEKAIRNLKFPARNANGKQWFEYYYDQRRFVFKYGGARYGKARDYNDSRKAVLFCREYTITDKLHYSSGLPFSQVNLDSFTIVHDLNKELTEQRIPVYFFHGLHDHQTSYPIAKKYFEELKAPAKKFYTFQHSAHSPHIEEYELFENIIKRDILKK